MSCGARISSRRCPTPRRPARPTIRATSPITCGGRRKPPTGTDLKGGSRNRARPAGCAASASRPTSRRVATTVPTPPTFASMTMAASLSSPGRNRRARATPPRMPRSFADHLRLPPDRVRMIQGDTDLIATGTGTGGSSSIPCGGASVAGATRKLADMLKEVAADALETAVSDLEIAEGGAVRVAGTDRLIAFADLARRPEARRRALVAEDAFVPEEATYPNGTHLAEVEIDPDTG